MNNFTINPVQANSTTSDALLDGKTMLTVVEHPTHLTLQFTSSSQQDTVLAAFRCESPIGGKIGEDLQTLTTGFCVPERGGEAFHLPRGFAHRLRAFADHAGIALDWVSETAVQRATFEQLFKTSEGLGNPMDENESTICKTLLENDRCGIEVGVTTRRIQVSVNGWACLHQAGLTTRALLVVPCYDLLEETFATVRTLTPWPELIGILTRGQFDPQCSLLVTGYGSPGSERHPRKYLLREWLQGVDTVIFLEADLATSSLGRKLTSLCHSPRVWGLSTKLSFDGPQYTEKNMVIEALFGPPVYMGPAPAETCKIRIGFHHHKAWSGAVDRQDLPENRTDRMPCDFLCTPSHPVESGRYHGLGKGNYVPELCRKPNPLDIIGHNELGEPIYRDEALRPTLGPGLTVIKKYDESRMIPDRTRFGVYASENRSGLVPEPYEVLYRTRTNAARVFFEERNQWALDLATFFKDRNEPFAITVSSVIHAKRMADALR